MTNVKDHHSEEDVSHGGGTDTRFKVVAGFSNEIGATQTGTLSCCNVGFRGATWAGGMTAMGARSNVRSCARWRSS